MSSIPQEQRDAAYDLLTWLGQDWTQYTHLSDAALTAVLTQAGYVWNGRAYVVLEVADQFGLLARFLGRPR